jgi:heme/copper-type cytochrome/quinol oxidase subunit 2
MSRWIPAIASLSPLAAYAQAAEKPVEMASPVVVIGFIVLFVGICAAYVWFTWRNEKKNKQASEKT